MATDDPHLPPPAPDAPAARPLPWRRWWARWLAWWRGGRPGGRPAGPGAASGHDRLAHRAGRLARPSAAAVDSDEQRARDLLAAIDAGGLPLNPARVNDIARRLGLEVSSTAPMDQTVARIRALLAR